MKFDEYQQLALRTAKDTTRTHKLMECALGLAGESGEVADHIKKYRYQGHDLNIDHIKGELGDVLWYVATMARALGLDLSEVASANVAKLKARYPDGFDEARSRDRGDGLLNDAQAVAAIKASADRDSDICFEGIYWRHLYSSEAGEIEESMWLVVDDGDVDITLHRVGSLWTLKRADVPCGVFDSARVDPRFRAGKALRWAAARLNTLEHSHDCKAAESPTLDGEQSPDGGRCDSVCKATTNDHAALFEAHPLPWKVYVDPDPPTAMAAVFVDDANDDPICDASSITGEDWHSLAFARLVVSAASKYADSHPSQPVEPHEPPIATIDHGPPCSLAECPPGLFRVGDRLGFKSEYGADAYVLESGEFWWGGYKTSWERAEQTVQPVVIAGYKEPTVIIPSERLELEERMREHMKSHRVVVKGGTK